jgi:diaminopimelate epimerase
MVDMATVTLTKHHGLGNDFLVVFHAPVPEAELSELARRLCDRRRGVGADGLLIAESPPADHEATTRHGATMLLYNADGSRAEMSGNGIRCFVQALSMRHDGNLDPVTVHTDAGVRLVTVEATDDPQTILASVDMGPVEPIGEPEGWETLGCHPDRPVAHLSLGNPHSVVGVDDVGVVDLVDLGGKVPHVNLEIVEPADRPDEVRMRVHERGAGITEACGTGACAAAVASASWGLATPTDGKLTVHMDGGSATVALDTPAPGRVTLTGPATYVATIEIEI